MNFKQNSLFTRNTGYKEEPMESQGGVLAVWGSPSSGKTVVSVKLADYLGVSEYMRLVITAAGIKDAMESAVISTVNDNYNEVFHCVREGYAAGYEPDGESFAASVDYGDIYSRMSFLLGLEENGDGYVRINNGGEQEYRLSNLSVSIPNNALGAGGGSYYADASIRLEVPVRFAGKIITNMSINLKVRAAYTEKF